MKHTIKAKLIFFENEGSIGEELSIQSEPIEIEFDSDTAEYTSSISLEQAVENVSETIYETFDSGDFDISNDIQFHSNDGENWIDEITFLECYSDLMSRQEALLFLKEVVYIAVIEYNKLR